MRVCLILSCLAAGAQAFFIGPAPSVAQHRMASTALHAATGAGTTSGSGVAELLTTAVTARTVSNEDVFSVLSKMEEEALKKSAAKLPGASAVRGKGWEIVYSSILKHGYMPQPVKEVVKVDYEQGLIRIDTVAGPIPLGSMLGTCGWSNNVLTFNFDTYALGPLKVNMPPKEKTYAFFYVDENVAAARSSSGSLTLMARV